MRKLLLASVAVLALGAAPSFAQSTNADAGAAVGGTVGGAAGATAGFFVGGPVGAVIGGFTGALIGAEAGVEASTVEYAANNPVALVSIDGDLEIGAVLDEDIEIYPVEGDDEFGYIYANNRVYIVNLETREIVQSPGYLITQDTIAYIEDNPIDSVELDGDLEAGFELDTEIEVAALPDNDAYGYVYLNDRPALVDLGSRRVVYIVD